MSEDRHIAYIHAVDGGFGGYQATCPDCNWRGELHERKDDARPEADAHFRDLPPAESVPGDPAYEGALAKYEASLARRARRLAG